jgi:uncharacterized membrane protein
MAEPADRSGAAGVNAPAAAVHGQDTAPDPFARPDRPAWQVTLWPNRSLSVGGGRAVLALTAAGLALMLAPFVNSPYLPALAPFLGLTLTGLWLAFRRSRRDGGLTEVLRLWPDLITVERQEPTGRRLTWHANPHWVTAQLYPDGKVENYLTLRGNGREIELGAFLSPEERAKLCDEVRAALHRLRP